MAVTRKLSTSLSLPSALNVPPTDFTAYSAMIYGRKQWGKSTLASQYPNSINLQFEPGRRGLNIRMVSPKTHEQSLEYLSLIYEDDDTDFCIFDTIDRFYDGHLLNKCKELSNGEKTHPNQFGNEGYAIWDIVKNEFEAIFETLLDAGKKFILVSHDKKVTNKDRDGQEWIRWEPTCKPAAWKIAQSMCDFVFHVDFLNGDRIITVRDLDNSTLASCNPEIDCFLNVHDGYPLRRFRIPNDNKKAFSSVMDAFNNKLQDYDFQPKVELPKKSTRTALPKKG
jgi:hypothetical protein